MSGTYTVNGVCSGSFSGTEAKVDLTFPAQAAGFYTGTLSGTVVVEGVGTFNSSGSVHVIAAEDGRLMALAFASAVIQGVTEQIELGGFLAAALDGTISGTLLDGTTINGSFNTATLTASGSFSSSFIEEGVLVTHSGTWSVTRQLPLPVPAVAITVNPASSVIWFILLDD